MLENLGKRHIEIRFKTIRLNEYRKSQDSVLGKNEVFIDCKKERMPFCYSTFISQMQKALCSLLGYICKLMAKFISLQDNDLEYLI